MPSRLVAIRAGLTMTALVALTAGLGVTAGATASVALVAPEAAAGQGTLNRVAGPDRVATAIAASQAGFPSDQSASAIVMAKADNFADGLAGAPLAARMGGPMLITPTALLTSPVIAEMQRVLPKGRTIYLLGGTQALSDNIDAQVSILGYNPVRLSGVDRYDTAIKIAQHLGEPPSIFEADGTNFPDGLSAGPAAIVTKGIVLLTAGHTQSPATAAYIAAHPFAVRYAVGGAAAAADPRAQALAGTDRYDTSVIVAQHIFASPSVIGVASGAAFPDALTGGPVAGLGNSPLVLVPGDGPLPATTSDYFTSVSNSVLIGWLFGGTSAVSTAMSQEVAQALVLVPPPS